MGKRGRPIRKKSRGAAEENVTGHLTPTGADVVSHQPAASPISSSPSTEGERPQGKLTMEKRGRPRKRSNGEAEDGKSGDLITPTSARHQKVSNSTPSPLGFLSLPMHYPPAPSRYPTRCGKPVLGQCAILTTPSRYPLRSRYALRSRCPSAIGVTSHDSTLTSDKTISAETIDNLSPTTDNLTSKLPFQAQVSNSTPATSSGSPNQDAKCKDHSHSLWDTWTWLVQGGEPTENLDRPVTESEDWSTPTENDLIEIENLTSGLLHQIQAQENLQLAASPTPTGESTDTLIVSGNGEEVLTKNLEQNAAPTPSVSLNLTEMAAMAYDDSSDDEVRSALDVALVTVNGYRVKEEFASLLREIISKYGDIAKDSSFQSMKSRSSLLEMVCGIFQKLQGSKFTEITPTELKSLLDLVGDIELVRVEVGWLHKRLEEIYEAKLLLKGSSSLKEEKTRINEAIEKAEREVEGYKAEMLRLQEKISLAEDKLAAMKGESEKVNETALDTKTKVKCFYQRCLVDGLL